MKLVVSFLVNLYTMGHRHHSGGMYMLLGDAIHNMFTHNASTILRKLTHGSLKYLTIH